MDLFKAIILGIVEGLTEFLPVSSTGHLILVGHMLGVDDPTHKDFSDAFEVVIQIGAVLAVVVYYRKLLAERLAGLMRRDVAAVQLAFALAIGFVPAAAAGFLLHHAIERRLFGTGPVVIALIAGGVVMLMVEGVRRVRKQTGLEGLQHVTPRRALVIGIGQCFSLWPGTSRSMSTIVAGQISGLSTATATEFSFLLAIPTLGAATLFKLVKSRHVLLAHRADVLALVVGTVVSFAVAWGVIAAFLRYVRRAGMSPFGAYLILVGIAIVVLSR
ncbi:MAG: undecaprenyl-diphosphate phosphatase [Deltaproteobacteria bacterium]